MVTRQDNEKNQQTQDQTDGVDQTTVKTIGVKNQQLQSSKPDGSADCEEGHAYQDTFCLKKRWLVGMSRKKPAGSKEKDIIDHAHQADGQAEPTGPSTGAALRGVSLAMMAGLVVQT